MEHLQRRDFLKQTALFGGGLILGQHLLTDGTGTGGANQSRARCATGVI